MQISDGELQMDVSLQKCMQLHKAPPPSRRVVREAFFMNLLWNAGWQIRKHEYWKHLLRFTLWVDTFNMLTKSLQF